MPRQGFIVVGNPKWEEKVRGAERAKSNSCGQESVLIIYRIRATAYSVGRVPMVSNSVR